MPLIKRTLDIGLALVLLTIAAIPMLIIAVAIRLTSAGPVLHWSDRVGRYGVVFKMPKFRTMRIGAPQLATHLLTDSEKWITPLGRLLRKTSLDELPQLWSIVVGDLSFVGPRPALFNQYDLIEHRTAAGVDRLRPGLTGWAQINGRDSLSVLEKVRCDVYYLQNHSLLFDMRIMLTTAPRLLSGRNVQLEGRDHGPQTEAGTNISDISGAHFETAGSHSMSRKTRAKRGI